MVNLNDLKVGSKVRALSTSSGLDADLLWFPRVLVIGEVYEVCEVVDDPTNDPLPVAISVPNHAIFDDGFYVTLDNIELLGEEL